MRCLVRDAAKAGELEARGAELHIGDVTDAGSLEGAAKGIDVAYFLVHSMAGGEGFAAREREGALNFARMAKREGVERVVYLGGLGEDSTSKHLQSRHEAARLLAAEGPPLTYFRAAMVVGAGSESYRTLRYLVGRLPVMVAPAWLRGRQRSRLGLTRRSSTCDGPRRCPSRRGGRCKSAAPTSSPTARCSIGWRWRWANASR